VEKLGTGGVVYTPLLGLPGPPLLRHLEPWNAPTSRTSAAASAGMGSGPAWPPAGAARSSSGAVPEGASASPP